MAEYPIANPITDEIRIRTGPHTGLEEGSPDVIELTFKTGASGVVVVLQTEAAQTLFEHLEEVLFG